MSVLIVEDDLDTRETMQMVLEQAGYDVTGASNGKEALDRLAGMARPPCVILLDLMMPIMSGAEFLEARSEDAKLMLIPVVLVSAWAKEAEHVEGVQGFIGKPFEFDALLGVVAEHCPVKNSRGASSV